MTTILRRVAGGALALAAPLLILITYGALRGRLPDPMPVHWNQHGQVDSSVGVAGFFAGALIIAVVLALGAIAATSFARSAYAGRILATMLTVGAWMAAAVWTATAVASDGAPAADQVEMPRYVVYLVLLVPVALGMGARLVLPGRWRGEHDPVPDSSLSFARGEAVVWIDRVEAPWARIAAAVVGLAAVVTWWVVRSEAVAFVIVAALLAVVLVTMSELAVRIDRRGLHTLWGPFGWPRPRVPLEQITAAHAEEIRPLQWGGWGYRLSRRGASAVIRRGPGLVVSREGRPSYAVTIPHAEAGAEVLNALLARAGRATAE